MQNSIHKKNRLLEKWIKCNNKDNNKALYDEYKVYRNNLSILMNQSKKVITVIISDFTSDVTLVILKTHGGNFSKNKRIWISKNNS